jgi:DNA-binding LacI/PurR family transcriptional regulator
MAGMTGEEPTSAPAAAGPPRLAEIARAAGVSRTTVSNAFNRPDQLSAALRTRILETARELGYAGPNQAARALRTGRSGIIGVVFSDDLPYMFSDPAAIAMMRGMAEACAAHETSLLLIPNALDSDAGERALAAAVDGYILHCLPTGTPVLDALQRRRLPLVAVDHATFTGARVGIDDRAAARRAASHLIALDHRRLAILALELAPDARLGLAAAARLEQVRYADIRERLLGYLEGAAAAGLDPGSIPVIETDENTAAAGARAAELALAAAPRPTALLCMSDVLALGAVGHAAERGIAVPRDLSIVGFDDIPMAADLVPPLTTIRQPLAERGRRAVELLLAGAPPGAILLPTELVERGTTAPARG